MPKLKQPASLESLAMELVVKSVLRFCDQPRAGGSLETLLRRISIIKKDLHDLLTCDFSPGFSNRLLNEYEWDECCRPKHSEWSMKIALEMIMDVDVVGLRCKGEILRHLDHRDAHRLRGLVELDLEYFFPDVPISLNTFQLNYLTTFIHPHDCTDVDLTVIRDNCPKLQELKIIFSQVTDEGLRTLNSCSELLVLDLWGCECITESGVINLISACEKLTELRVDGVDFLSRLNKQCLSMKRLTMTVEGSLTDAHLHLVVLNFPNLNHFGLIHAPKVVDLRILKSLSKLEEIDLDLVNMSGNTEPVDFWRSLKELLTLVGRNIKMLNFNCWDDAFLIEQDGLNFLFEFCPNIEFLKFDHQFEDLVIPPFERLKVLIPRDPQSYAEHDESRVTSEIKFDKMLNLESLSLMDIPVGFDTVKSIILDHVNFPKLSELKMDPLEDKSLGETLEYIIRNNNLDMKIRYDCDSRAQVERNLLH